MLIKLLVRILMIMIASLMMGACGRGGDGTTASSNTLTYTVGGTVSGLATGVQVMLLNNGDDATTVVSDGAFICDPVGFKWQLRRDSRDAAQRGGLYNLQCLRHRCHYQCLQRSSELFNEGAGGGTNGAVKRDLHRADAVLLGDR